MFETQQTISEWAEEIFGPVSSNARVAARANEEIAELLRVLTVDDADPKAGEEIADVVIVLNRLASKLGVDLQEAVNKKMEVNRSREWKQDGSGHGYHLRDKVVDRIKLAADAEAEMSRLLVKLENICRRERKNFGLAMMWAREWRQVNQQSPAEGLRQVISRLESNAALEKIK